ncbi:MAG: ATP-binding protein [Candidatus Atribacteria bacterium]|nr:ATP-binding protein [Candidatus Atribacteria bacterium]
MFKNEKLVIWEYVSNGLEYIEEGTNPIVFVTIDNRNKQISIKDNGRGMDWKGLQNFFIMHGENLDRKKGRPVRGMFGTGKSAAFGIAEVLRVRTVRNGKRSIVELLRSEVSKMNREDPIPVRTIDKEKPTEEENGTIIEIEDVHLQKLNQADVIKYIERHLAKWRNATVYVNNHECEISEPVSVSTYSFKPEGSLKDILGDVELTIRVAGEPLDKDLFGVSIYSNGIWHETTLAGIDGREMAQYIFGEIDVPKLDEDNSPITPFDLSRSMHLNPSNEIVRAIYTFIGSKADSVRRMLVKDEKERKASENAKKLAKQAESIADIINEDFQDFRSRLLKAKARGTKGFDTGTEKVSSGTNDDDLIFGSQIPAEIVEPQGDFGSEGGRRVSGKDPRTLSPQVTKGSPNSEKLGKPSNGEGNSSHSRGGFHVEFKPMSKDANRALYVGSERTIYINIEHPQLVCVFH